MASNVRMACRYISKQPEKPLPASCQSPPRNQDFLPSNFFNTISRLDDKDTSSARDSPTSVAYAKLDHWILTLPSARAISDFFSPDRLPEISLSRCCSSRSDGISTSKPDRPWCW